MPHSKNKGGIEMEGYSFYMANDLEKYVGQWIAVVGGKVIAHDESAKKAYDEARKQHPDKTPFLACIPKNTAAY